MVNELNEFTVKQSRNAFRMAEELAKPCTLIDLINEGHKNYERIKKERKLVKIALIVQILAVITFISVVSTICIFGLII